MKTNIFDEMRRMQEQMDNLFDNFFMDNPRKNFYLDNPNNKQISNLSNFREPICDMYETDKEIITEIELPGIDKKDIKVNVSENEIEIKTETKNENKIEDKKKGMYKLERSYSGFYRKFNLPENANANNAEADYKNGILKIKVPKKKIEHKNRKLIDIK